MPTREKANQARFSRMQLVVPAALMALVALAGMVSGCGGASSSAAPAKGIQYKHDPANFRNPAIGNNPYFPMRTGSQFVRIGSTDVGSRSVPHQVTTTVTDVHRMIQGVNTVGVLDHELDAGQISQESIDWLAVDKSGNLWDFGGYTEEFQNGQYVSAVDPWLSGVNGARAGVLVQGKPKAGTPPYAVASPAAEEGDVASVIQVGVKRCVPFKCFSDVLVVREGKASAPDNEYKYYARGVGQIDNVPRGASVHNDVEQLVNVTQLSPSALAEASAEVLRLDHHAPKTSPDIFAKLPLGKRG